MKEGYFRKENIEKVKYECTENKGQKFSDDKAPIFTFCKQFVNAIEHLALRSKEGHEKYIETDADWQNFSRVDNPDYQYSNAEFRHALEIGGEDNKKEHLTAAAWNAIARLEMYLRESN